MQPSNKPLSPAAERLAALEKAVASLEPILTSEHSEHGLQGLSGLYGQYRVYLAEIEQLRLVCEESKGTPLDELAKRRAGKSANQGSSEVVAKRRG